MEREQKYKITLKPFSDGKLIHVYESNPEFGYIVLESDEPYFCPTILDVLKETKKNPKRQAFQKGSINILEKFVETLIVKNLPGRIRIIEYLEGEIPEYIKARFIRDDIPYEEAIKPYLLVIKSKNNSIEYKIRDRFRVKSNDLVLTKNGKRILRFFIYQVDNEADLLIKGIDIKFEPIIPSFMGISESEEESEEQEEDKEVIEEDEDTSVKSISENIESSQTSKKKENSVMVTIVVLIALAGLLSLIIMPTFAIIIGVIFGSMVIFFFTGSFYEAIFSKNADFNLLRTILVGVAVIIIIGIIIFISELTKTPNDPEMWRHP